MTQTYPRRRHVLYLTYDGLQDPLGQSQILPYLRGLGEYGYTFDVISFEKRPSVRRRPAAVNHSMRWTALRYHKRPVLAATIFDACQGFTAASLAVVLGRTDLIHVRSTVPGAMVLPLAECTQAPLVFDTRALWTDEKVDVGGWKRGGVLHRMAQSIEAQLYRRANVITVLTNAMREFLRSRYPRRCEITAPIHVIPTCASMDRFHPNTQPDPELARQLKGTNVLTYVGSLNGWYMAHEMARFYLAWRKVAKPARFLLISHHPPGQIQAVLSAANIAHELVHRSGTADETAAYVACAHAGVCFRRPLFSTLASAPTKVGELLAAGVPVAANRIGDLPSVLGGTGAGVLVDHMSDEELLRAAHSLHELATSGRSSLLARQIGERWFSLSDGVRAYHEVYQLLTGGHAERRMVDLPWPREL